MKEKNVFDISMKRNEKEIQQCMRMSKEFDKIIINSVNENVEPRFIAGTIGDALARFLERIDPNGKQKLWEVVKTHIVKKAKLSSE